MPDQHLLPGVIAALLIRSLRKGGAQIGGSKVRRSRAALMEDRRRDDRMTLHAASPSSKTY
jgi:hypothetical protein